VAEPFGIPRRWDEVTPEWMTAALAGTHPDARVTAVDVLMSDNGNNRRARFGLRYRAGSGPALVFAKAEGDFRDVHAQNGNLFNEADLFASGVALAVEHPRPYRVIIDRPARDYVIVMEDVTGRGADPRDATRPLTVDQVAQGLRGLARLHSRFWGWSAATRPALGWVRTWTRDEGFLEPLRAAVPAGLDVWAAHGAGAEIGYDTAAVVDLVGRFLTTLARGPLTLLHGDAHIGNTYVLPDGDVGFLDWQVVRRGHWSQDVGYFLVSALTVADRRAHEADLLAEYLAALDVPGPRPAAEDARLRYRASTAYGLGIWLATTGAVTSQPREVCLALCERYATAFADLDTPAALAELGA
jgi:hypothetical protein